MLLTQFIIEKGAIIKIHFKNIAYPLGKNDSAEFLRYFLE
jgi:hypothetical protein